MEREAKSAFPVGAAAVPALAAPPLTEDATEAREGPDSDGEGGTLWFVPPLVAVCRANDAKVVSEGLVVSPFPRLWLPESFALAFREAISDASEERVGPILSA